MTTHKTLVHAKCPINGEWDYYEVTLRTDILLLAETFQEACSRVRGSKMTQEDLAQNLWDSLTIPETEDHMSLSVEGRHGQNTATVCMLPE